ncbi:MAG: DUF732 domain-containing protein [Nocardiaceae bacterium]|nr:DUF732 domain-containing protein [Nocardiaceae bacterium]
MFSTRKRVHGRALRRGMSQRQTAGAALSLLAATVLVAGCGSDDVSESGGAGLTTPPTSAGTAGSQGPAATAPDETLQNPPSGFPGPAHPEVDPNAPMFLAALKKSEVPYSGNGNNAVSIGEYVCAATRDRISEDRISINVLAMASNEQMLAQSQFPPEDATKVYIDTARSTLCS